MSLRKRVGITLFSKSSLNVPLRLISNPEVKILLKILTALKLLQTCACHRQLFGCNLVIKVYEKASFTRHFAENTRCRQIRLCRRAHG